MSELLKCGYISLEELKDKPGIPSEARMNRGPVAVIECIQCIPCNPCEGACPKGAITVGENITSLPALDEEKCIGCGLCVARCPGLAIFIVDKSYSVSEAAIEFPFEYSGLPEPGDKVAAVDRNGRPVCEGTVISVRNSAANDRTPVIKIAVPKEYADEVRSIKRRK